MEDLAAAANVGLTTPYNLFGNKAGVILALHQLEVERFTDLVSSLDEEDPLDSLLKMVDLAMGIYLSDEDYFRSLCHISFIANQGVLEHFDKVRDVFWKNVLQDCGERGLFHRSINLSWFSHFFSNVYWECVRDWAEEKIESDDLRHYAAYSLLLALAGAVKTVRAGEVRRRILFHQASIAIDA